MENEMSEAIKDHDFKSGEWFYALDGAVYEFINDEKGSRKICDVVDLEKTAFMSESMKKRGHILASAPDMYEMLESLSELMPLLDEQTHPQIECDALKCDIDKLLAKARGE